MPRHRLGSRRVLPASRSTEFFDELINISHVDLSFNYLSGTIPTQVWSHGPCSRTRMRNNRAYMTPSFHRPRALCCARVCTHALERLTANDDSCDLPEHVQVGKVRNLRLLNMHDNQLSGTIPTEIAHLGSALGFGLGDDGFPEGLVELRLDHNNLTGSERSPRVERRSCPASLRACMFASSLMAHPWSHLACPPVHAHVRRQSFLPRSGIWKIWCTLISQITFSLATPTQ